jgi:hypothetical protein
MVYHILNAILILIRHMNDYYYNENVSMFTTTVRFKLQYYLIRLIL